MSLQENATVTLESQITGTWFTFRIRKVEDSSIFFVSLLNGPDNENSFRYLGTIRISQAGPLYSHGHKSKITKDAPSAKAFEWTWSRLVKGIMPTKLDIWHEGRCGRCNRKLTVPESIATGMGPECASRTGVGGLFFAEAI